MSLVAITGAAGEVGRGVIPHLEQHHSLRLLDLQPHTEPPWQRVDILDWSSLLPALQGCSSILHLAVASGHSGTYEDDACNDQRFDVNVRGTWHVFECARRAGVKRIVQVSSLMVVWGHGTTAMVAGDAPSRPVGTYALTKSLGEQIAEHYARTTELEVLVLRIAAPLDIDAPDLRQRPVRPQQVPFPDLARAFHLALTVPWPGFRVVTIVGESSRRIWDLEPARQVLAYEPSINLDGLGVNFAEPFDVPPQGRRQ